uniref:Uncharacterized protein n=1 Tax=Lotus japonicus TaxID=34305 RepID=I3SBT5_LOTJA|nr:unknown [Lotus japonicus]
MCLEYSRMIPISHILHQVAEHPFGKRREPVIGGERKPLHGVS